MSPARRRPLAFLVRDFGGGGVQRSQLRLASAFAVRGHAVDLVGGARPGPSDRLAPEGSRLVVLPRPPKYLAKLLPLLADPAALHLLARLCSPRRGLHPPSRTSQASCATCGASSRWGL